MAKSIIIQRKTVHSCAYTGHIGPPAPASFSTASFYSLLCCVGYKRTWWWCQRRRISSSRVALSNAGQSSFGCFFRFFFLVLASSSWFSHYQIVGKNMGNWMNVRKPCPRRDSWQQMKQNWKLTTLIWWVYSLFFCVCAQGPWAKVWTLWGASSSDLMGLLPL